MDGLSIHDTKIQNRNIAAFDGQVVGGYVFSALMVQTTIENNNTIVQCEIIQSLVAVESLPSVMLLLQGNNSKQLLELLHIKHVCNHSIDN